MRQVILLGLLDTHVFEERFEIVGLAAVIPIPSRWRVQFCRARAAVMSPSYPCVTLVDGVLDVKFGGFDFVTHVQ